MKPASLLWLTVGWAVVAGAAPPAPVESPTESPAVMTTPTAVPAVATPKAAVRNAAVASSANPTTPQTARGKVTDHVELDQTTITGNRELPNVMVIVPWKESGPGEPGKPGTSLLDEALAPLDREEFRRELQYDQALRGKAPPVLTKPAPLSSTTSP
jgi:hypothetical protein